MTLNIEYSNKPISNQKLDAIILFIFEDSGLTGSGLNSLPNALKDNLNTTLKLKVFTGKQYSCQQLLSGYANIPQILAVGLGKKSEINTETLRRASGIAGKKLNSLKANNIGFIVTSHLQNKSEIDVGQALVEGLTLGSYKFNKYKESDDEKSKLKSIKIQCFDSENVTSKNALKTGKMRADCTNLARNLGNTPANDLKPKDLAFTAENIAKQYKMNCTVLEEKQMKKLGMGMLLGVSRGSSEPAKLILMEYFHKKAKQTIALVGKGVTFDSGGISLKPGRNMDEMKFDMCGAATVLGIFKAIASLKPKINAVCIVPSTENLLGGKAYKPGDILKAYNGKTIEVLNTDAEGRLILADGLSYASKHYDPEYILDFATLTGAVLIALGHIATGIMGTNEELIEMVKKSSKNVNEKVWEFPLWPEFCKQVQSEIADVKNIGAARQAGTIAGGAFLKEFVGENIPWVHFDIAGTAWGGKANSMNPKGSATGWGIRLVLDMFDV